MGYYGTTLSMEEIGMETVGYQVGMDKEAYVEVQITRHLRVGQLLKINPSEAYLGIESGNIKVKAILPFASIKDYGVDLANYATEHARIELEDYEGFGNEGYYEMQARLYNGLWVVYQHTYDPDNTGTYVLPLEMFVDHTMLY